MPLAVLHAYLDADVSLALEPRAGVKLQYFRCCPVVLQ